VTLRRLQGFHLKPGGTFQWSFGTAKGEGKADADEIITIPSLKITSEPETLRVHE